jgi:uncharacterized protein with GYD domain
MNDMMTTPVATRRHVSLLKLTPKGLTEPEGSPDRRRLSEEHVAALGRRLIAFFVTVGAQAGKIQAHVIMAVV